MTKFKITIESTGMNSPVHVETVGSKSSYVMMGMDTEEGLDKLLAEVRTHIVECSNHLTQNEIACDLRSLGFNPSLLDDIWTPHISKRWTIYDVLSALKTNNFEELLSSFTDPKIMANNKYTNMIMYMSTLYRRNALTFYIMTRFVLPAIKEDEYKKIFHKMYLAAAMSDNIAVFETLQAFSINFVDIDLYLVEAAKHKAQAVVNFILFQHSNSGEGLDNALKEAVKTGNDNIITNLISHGATFRKCE